MLVGSQMLPHMEHVHCACVWQSVACKVYVLLGVGGACQGFFKGINVSLLCGVHCVHDGGYSLQAFVPMQDRNTGVARGLVP